MGVVRGVRVVGRGVSREGRGVPKGVPFLGR